MDCNNFSDLILLSEEEERNYVSSFILATAFYDSITCSGDSSLDEVLIGIKEKPIHVGFSRYQDSFFTRAGIDINYKLYFSLEGSLFSLLYPPFIHFNGTWEGLDDSLQKEVNRLGEFNYRIDYKGHLRKLDVII